MTTTAILYIQKYGRHPVLFKSFAGHSVHGHFDFYSSKKILAGLAPYTLYWLPEDH
jgi:hypothetical protein